MHWKFSEWESGRKSVRRCSAQFFMRLGMLVPALGLSAQDTVRVRSTSAPAWGTNVRLTEVWTIGRLDTDGGQSSGSLGGFAVDRMGRFYVFDSKDRQIRQFGTDGKFVRNVGRQGKGPGEYEMVFGMDVANDSLLTVLDLATARTSYFRPDGKFHSSFTEPRATWGFENMFVVDRSGFVSVAVPNAAPRGQSTLNEHEMTARPWLLRFRSDGSRVDSVQMPIPRQTPPRSFYLATADGGNNTFVPVTHHAALRVGGFVSGHGDALRLVVRTSAGAVRVIERATTTVPVGPDEHENWKAWALYFMNQGNSASPQDIPRSKPVFRGLQSDHDSRIWVSLYAPAQKIALPPRPAGDKRPLLNWQQPATYEVFATDGVYLGRVILPMRSRFLAARGNRLWVLVKGPDDEDMIRLYTISGVK